MWNWIIAGLIALTLETGASNNVSALIYRVIGTWSATYVDSYGEAVATTFGPGAPMPDWMPRPPGALIVIAARSVRGPVAHQFASMDVTTRVAKAELHCFYDGRPAAQDCTITQRDADIIDPGTARVLGIDSIMTAVHPEHDRQLKITTRSADGWILPSRMVQIVWWDGALVPPR